MSILTLEVPDKLLESLKAQAQKANTSVEQLAVSALSKEAYLAQLRADAQEGIDAIKEGRFTAYDSVDEMMEDIETQFKERLTQRTHANKKWSL